MAGFVFDGAHARAVLHRSPAVAGRLVVTFSHMEPGRAPAFPEARPVSRWLKLGLDHLQVLTRQNDWYLNDDLPDLRAALAPVAAGYKSVAALGFSMGGYGALLLSRALALNWAVLVSPQISPFVDDAPGDTRYRRFARLMRRDLALRPDDIAPGLQGAVLFDPRFAAPDAAHARAILALAPGLSAVPVPFGGHPASKSLHVAGLWTPFQDLLLNEAGHAADAAALRRRARRQSAAYASAREAALARRRAARDGKDLP